MNQLVNTKTLGAILICTSLSLVPGRAIGFLQTTKVDGRIGADISGVWLGLYYTAPTFRMRVEFKPDKQQTFSVAPVSAELRPLMPGETGAVLTEEVSGENTKGATLFKGDIITAVDGRPVKGVDGLSEQLAAIDDKDWAVITIVRPSLKQTAANLVKIRYGSKVEEIDGASVVTGETIFVQWLDGLLPFADEVEAARQGKSLFIPSKAQIDAAGENWYRLESPEYSLFVGGEHRVVGAEDYELDLRKDPNLESTEFAVISKMKGNPTLGGGTTIAIYGFREVSSDSMSGSYVQSSMASAPFPISIDFVGAFKLIKLEEFSMKDAEYAKSQADKQAGVEDKENWDSIELEPDVPGRP